MKTLIIGGSGKIGQKLIAHLSKEKSDFRVMVRTQAQLESLKSQGVDAVLGDLEGDISEAFNGCERIVFTAGSGSKTTPHKTLLVDLWGSIRAIEEAEKQGVKHFIMISSLKSDRPLDGPEKIRHYLVARNLADDRLIRSSLPYTLLRPGRLLDEPATGKVSNKFDWADATNTTSVITRDDVVAIIAQVISLPEYLERNSIIDVINGDISIDKFLSMATIEEAVA
ncbi:SDR family oxidoreductase [Marinagarivorans cellulosilyticus]|uniref:NAD(P)-binding domain-containing protein n=1 Tax=Marinagarivorans cellulosilyticus TaxID=2721545 RepID=A0AAN1WF49_9GAMM|nr:SDR family oxidoreductase [Marinagarivorans cellulosilyticus]BCD96462.1 hypothetical protein MARGE09_P0662 [Marinagarivorans cellulosilyticus]